MKNWDGAKGLKIFLRWWLFLFFFFGVMRHFPNFLFLTLYLYLMKGIILHVLFSGKLHIFNWEKTNQQCHYINLTQTILSLDSVFKKFAIGSFTNTFDLASHIFHLQSIEPPLSMSEILKSVSQSLMSLWLEAAASPVGTGGIRNKIRKLIERVEVSKKKSCLETKRIMVSTCFVRHCLMHMPLCKGFDEEFENWHLHLWE